MPRLNRRDLLSSFVIAGLALLAVALACLHVASHGGPAWLEGQELAVFVKAVLVTATLMAIDICWKAQAA